MMLSSQWKVYRAGLKEFIGRAEVRDIFSVPKLA